MNYKNNPSQLKTNLRLNSKNKLSKLTDKEKETKSFKINNNLKKLLNEINFNILCTFIPTSNEPNIDLNYLINTTKTIYSPKYTKNQYIFSQINSISQLTTGNYNIKEPINNIFIKKKELESKLTLFLVPLLSFDSKGNRLGFGKGYYDRLLEKTNGKRIGIAFSIQEEKIIPYEDHDIKLDYIITEKKVLLC